MESAKLRRVSPLGAARQSTGAHARSGIPQGNCKINNVNHLRLFTASTSSLTAPQGRREMHEKGPYGKASTQHLSG
jgi:hypothetical protein